ncbi:hypothetical protein EVAR_316_1 [Eumeta japonica]|uniref:Uncharacterized protein n=1 Tax=Eumeta variegata TaxID=151549 RepID=A0A4C1SBY2_EUMVA|nr:hypothetical protein EVAR_316_1 [Eumeta japonica]
MAVVTPACDKYPQYAKHSPDTETWRIRKLVSPTSLARLTRTSLDAVLTPSGVGYYFLYLRVGARRLWHGDGYERAGEFKGTRRSRPPKLDYAGHLPQPCLLGGTRRRRREKHRGAPSNRAISYKERGKIYMCILKIP